MQGLVSILTADCGNRGSWRELLSVFRDRTAIINLGVSALNGFIRDHIGHEHSALEVDDIGAGGNADGLEFAPHAVITDTAGFLFAGNEMQLPAPVARDSIPYWHAIMLRQELVQRTAVSQY